MEATDVDFLQRIAELLGGPGGTFFLLVLFGAGLVTKKIVLGWVYDDCIKDGVTCRKDLADRITKGEAELDRLRQDRMVRRD